jgi:hypothetical protein
VLVFGGPARLLPLLIFFRPPPSWLSRSQPLLNERVAGAPQPPAPRHPGEGCRACRPSLELPPALCLVLFRRLCSSREYRALALLWELAPSGSGCRSHSRERLSVHATLSRFVSELQCLPRGVAAVRMMK